MTRRASLALGTLTALACALSMPDSSHAWDGKRRGFVFGVGVGLSPLSSIHGDYRGRTYDEFKAGVAFDALVGFAWNEHNVLAWAGNGVQHDSRHLEGRNGSILQGFYGPTWYHYFGPAGSSWYSMIGAGWYQYDTTESGIYICFNCGREPLTPLPSKDGLGFLIGGGYEFARHFQIGITAAGGGTGINDDRIWRHAHVDVALTWVGY